MNKYVRGIVDGMTGIIKMGSNKFVHGRLFRASVLSFASPLSEITIEKGAEVSLGRKFRIRSGARIRVRNGAHLSIGDNISLNHGCIIACRDNISIGDGTQFGPNVFIYDHDHDYKAKGGINAKKYKTGEIYIGNNVWIGAGCIILRNTYIGNNCVVASGSVVKGRIPDNCLLYQEKNTIKKFVAN